MEQVKRPDVDKIVGRSANELKRSMEITQSAVDMVGTNMEKHIASITDDLSELERNVKENMEKHSTEVKQMFEREVNPINAYLNTMHVKSDEVRCELDGLTSQVPKLQSKISGVSAQLQERESENVERVKG